MLADQLGVSLRTLYRDIATLTAQGATIEGEAGLGYVLRQDTFLPPLMFSAADAVLLGLQLVAARTDPALASERPRTCSPPGANCAATGVTSAWTASPPLRPPRTRRRAGDRYCWRSGAGARKSRILLFLKKKKQKDFIHFAHV